MTASILILQMNMKFVNAMIVTQTAAILLTQSIGQNPGVMYARKFLKTVLRITSMNNQYAKDIWRSYLNESKAYLKMSENPNLSHKQIDILILELMKYNILIDFWNDMIKVLGAV